MPEFRQNPVTKEWLSIASQRARYEEYCDGKADTLLGRNFYPPPGDLTAPHARQHTDGQLYWIISEGIRYSGMPAGRKLHTEEQIWQIVLYLRQLPGQVSTSPPHQPASYAPVQQIHRLTQRQALQ